MCVANNDREAQKSAGGLTFRKARAYEDKIRMDYSSFRLREEQQKLVEWKFFF